jgi:hypothetical protein
MAAWAALGFWAASLAAPITNGSPTREKANIPDQRASRLVAGPVSTGVSSAFPQSDQPR